MPAFDTLRAFTALNVEVSGVRKIAELAERWRRLPGGDGLRWTPPTKLHLTLSFFGDIDAGLVPPLRDALSAIAAGRPAPRLVFQGLSAFPSLEQARVLFVEVRGVTEVIALAAAIEDAAAALGLPRRERQFHPHLTVARTSAPRELTGWLATVPPFRVAASAPELVLYRSDLARPGAEYDALARLPLTARRQPAPG